MELCTTCLSKVNPKKDVRGYFIIEIVLWLFMVIPGLLYTLWRVAGGKQKVCPKCGSQSFVPIDSPAGKQLLASSQAQINTAPEQRKAA